jgi:hypothetical protein
MGNAALRSVPMTQKLHVTPVRLAEMLAARRDISDGRLPLGVAMTTIAGTSVVLWSLIAVALRSLL